MLILASASARRAELLTQIGVEFEVQISNVDETKLTAESAQAYVCRMADIKARVIYDAYNHKYDKLLVLAADTIISLEGVIIGKPADRQDCRASLRRLSGRQHDVLSAVAIASKLGVEIVLSWNRVFFRALPEVEICSYCDSDEPMDKAGAYAIQGRAAVFIKHLEGSYSSVMGLPIFETNELLENAKLALLKHDEK